MRLLSTLIFFVCGECLLAQAVVAGKVTDSETRAPLEIVTIYRQGTADVVETDANGKYRLEVPSGVAFELVFTLVGYGEERRKVGPLPRGDAKRVNVQLVNENVSEGVTVRESRIEDAGMVREDVTELKTLPTTTGNLESVLPNIALGASSGTGGELSSQYNVRGGNYDENLVYVNDFEIYRPQLIRAGQQEGLTFPNIDLIQTLSFSSGGFEAKYGDKLSSVLDIKYKRPEEFRASASASLLGATAHIEGSQAVADDGYRKLRYLVGARYKTTRYLLGTLDVQGEYLPDFTDIQTYITYDLNRDWQIGLLGNYNRSVFNFTPESRNTALGLIDFALRLNSSFEGQERDDFTTAMAGVSLTYVPERRRNPFYLKWLTSTYRADENERFDIIGNYRLEQIETSLGSDNQGEAIGELGNGTQQQFVRNFLTSTIANTQVKAGWELQQDREDGVTSSHFLQGSVRAQYENHDDLLNEWERLDSAGYSLPFDTTSVRVFSVLKRDADPLESMRYTAFLQDTYTWSKEEVAELRASFGTRFSYWSLNGEFFVSPRAQLLYKPLSGKANTSYRLAAGLYHQSPFYREMRNNRGEINTALQSQKSVHFVGGITHDFRIRNAKFRFITEAYYKRLWDLVSYEIDNVRIRYSGENDSRGYVAGIDFRLNGEFVKGAESWINVSLLQAKEQLIGVQHLRRFFESNPETGVQELQEAPVDYVSRPTDQLLTLSMFFQDYLPKNENIATHVNLTVGTGLAYGIPGSNRIYRNTFTFPAYHRVDIGFSVQLWKDEWRARKPNHPLRFMRNAWLSLEVFNLMQVQNVASNTWIKTIFQQQYAIPNYLTSRRLNLRGRFEF